MPTAKLTRLMIVECASAKRSMISQFMRPFPARPNSDKAASRPAAPTPLQPPYADSAGSPYRAQYPQPLRRAAYARPTAESCHVYGRSHSPALSNSRIRPFARSISRAAETGSGLHSCIKAFPSEPTSLPTGSGEMGSGLGLACINVYSWRHRSFTEGPASSSRRNRPQALRDRGLLIHQFQLFGYQSTIEPELTGLRLRSPGVGRYTFAM